MSSMRFSLPQVKDVPAPSAKRIVETVWEEADVYWFRRICPGAKCDVAAFPLHALADGHGANAGRERILGAAVCFGADGSGDHDRAAGGPVDAIVRSLGGRGFSSQRGRGWHVANDTVAAYLTVPSPLGEMAVGRYFFQRAGAGIG